MGLTSAGVSDLDSSMFGVARGIFGSARLPGAIEILAALRRRSKRFSELKKDTGLGPVTLARRLRRLSGTGLIWYRRGRRGGRKSVEYFLLSAGRDVLRLIRREQWRWEHGLR